MADRLKHVPVQFRDEAPPRGPDELCFPSSLPGQVTVAQGAPTQLDSGDWRPARLRVFGQQGNLVAIAEAVVPRTYQPLVVLEPSP